MKKDHQDQHECQLLYRLHYMPSKGYGLVATRDIEPSELIVAEEPLLKVPLTKEGDLVGQFNAEKQEFICPSLILALNQLADNDLFKFFSLADSCSRFIAEEHGVSDYKTGGKTNCGIIKTNSFFVDFPGDKGACSGQYLALFATIARLNHSCQPNCNHYWSGSQFNVRTIKSVKKGEELCISYMSPLQRSDFHTKISRRKILQDEFGFFCNCPLCADDTLKDGGQNDTDRQELLQIEHQWVHLGQEPEVALNLAKKQLELGQRLQLQPGLLAYIVLHCLEASSLVISSAMESNEVFSQGLKYAQIAKEYGQIAYGSDSDEAKVFANLSSLWKSTPKEDLFSVIQDAISRLRDL